MDSIHSAGRSGASPFPVNGNRNIVTDVRELLRIIDLAKPKFDRSGSIYFETSTSSSPLASIVDILRGRLNLSSKCSDRDVIIAARDGDNDMEVIIAANTGASLYEGDNDIRRINGAESSRALSSNSNDDNSSLILTQRIKQQIEIVLSDSSGSLSRVIRSHPDQMRSLQDLKEYYLPTLVKVYQAICDIKSGKIKGEMFQTYSTTYMHRPEGLFYISQEMNDRDKEEVGKLVAGTITRLYNLLHFIPDSDIRRDSVQFLKSIADGEPDQIIIEIVRACEVNIPRTFRKLYFKPLEHSYDIQDVAVKILVDVGVSARKQVRGGSFTLAPDRVSFNPVHGIISNDDIQDSGVVKESVVAMTPDEMLAEISRIQAILDPSSSKADERRSRSSGSGSGNTSRFDSKTVKVDITAPLVDPLYTEGNHELTLGEFFAILPSEVRQSIINSSSFHAVANSKINVFITDECEILAGNVFAATVATDLTGRGKSGILLFRKDLILGDRKSLTSAVAEELTHLVQFVDPAQCQDQHHFIALEIKNELIAEMVGRKVAGINDGSGDNLITINDFISHRKYKEIVEFAIRNYIVSGKEVKKFEELYSLGGFKHLSHDELLDVTKLKLGVSRRNRNPDIDSFSGDKSSVDEISQIPKNDLSSADGRVHVITEDVFQREVLEFPGLVLVDYYADWCGPCQRLAPVLEDVAGMYKGKVKFVKMNVDNLSRDGMARDYKRGDGIPALTLIRNGQFISSENGALPKSQLIQFIDLVRY